MLNIILLQLWRRAPFEPWLPSREFFSERINGGLALSRGHAKSSRVDPESLGVGDGGSHLQNG